MLLLVFSNVVWTSSAVAASSQQSTSAQEIEWVQLMPQDDLDALLNPPEMLLEIEDQSAEDNVDAFKQQEFEDEKAKRFQQALVSTTVVETFKDKNIRIPGFIVPLQSNEAQLVTEFFIVPYFGACLHLPPPPPNQIIFVAYNKGIKLDSLYDPFWFEGILKIELNENDMGTAAYKLAVAQISPYEE